MIACNLPTVPVIGYARTFVLDKRISQARITWLETTQSVKTDSNGAFTFCTLPGQKMTLVFHKKGDADIQTATVIVPQGGLTSIYNQPTFQVPTNITYAGLKWLLTRERRVTLDPHACQVITTVTKYHKTMADDPQGMPGAHIVLSQLGNIIQPSVMPFYFGMFKDGKTNPFASKLTATSLDGGVALFNVPSSVLPYTLTAQEAGYQFTRVNFLCRAGQVVNISPPLGPSIN